MATLIQAIAIILSMIILIFVAKWQVDDDIKKMEKRLDESNEKLDKTVKATDEK